MPYKKGMEALLKQEKGMAAVLVPGGALEALNSDKDQIRLVLNRRKGFIKLALRYNILTFRLLAAVGTRQPHKSIINVVVVIIHILYHFNF